MNQHTYQPTHREETMSRELKIYQYNVHRSKDVVMAQFLREQEVISADIIAIQEPWENPFQDNTHHPLKQTHELLYPAASEPGGRARVCMFISKTMGEHTHLVHSRDCQEVRIKTESSGSFESSTCITTNNAERRSISCRINYRLHASKRVFPTL
jgi:hypothetical protein